MEAGPEDKSPLVAGGQQCFGPPAALGDCWRGSFGLAHRTKRPPLLVVDNRDSLMHGC